ncbi:MAG: energy transducer TonB [Burkholderiales bacterium]|nr:energy transducer TonB [Burkholderiales bacterium]
MSATAPSIQREPLVSRNVAIAGGVVALHVAFLWALQTGLLRRAVEIIVPATILSEIITPPQPKVEPPPPVPKPPEPRPVVKRVQPALPPPPMPVAIVDPTPAPNAPTGVTAPQPPAPPIAAPVAVAPAPPAPAKVELPSSDADYLQNPKPAYPPISKRLGEQGKVMVRVLIAADGTAQKAEIRQSSGFERLDQAALATVQRWRYVPGKRNGVVEAMWFNVPINFVLE